MAQLNYTVNTEELETSFEVVPAGEYIAVIEASDYVSNKQGTGKILKLTYQIVDGPQKGKKVFENLNLENKSTQAEQIARRTLNSIGVAVGNLSIKDSAQLHGIPMKIDVGISESAEYGKQNKIKKHEPVKATGAQAPSQAPSQATNAGSDNFNVPVKQPWEK